MRQQLHNIIFEADTKWGKRFDVLLILLIILSIAIVLIESVPGHSELLVFWLQAAEWLLTGVFTLEYLVRIWITQKPFKYILSFYGIIDLLAILPSYIGLLFAGSQMFIVFRSLRLLRVFRVLKLTRYVQEASLLWKALKSSRKKISIFLYFILILVVILGTVMYLIENPVNPSFSSIPRSIYWAIVTLTTVGYGDIAPITLLGQFLASVVMILGYSIIAVPTGIVTSEITREAFRERTNTQVCQQCLKDDHEDNARYCSQCGAPMKE